MNLSRYILLLPAALLIASCSSDSTLEDENVVDDRIPMVFGTSSASSESVITRASASLESDFKVSTWKFGTTSQQTVMDQYKVDYNSSATTWNYVDVPGQIQRYWDLAAFPYEFRAVSPYNADNVNITDQGISLNATFKSQTYKDDTYNETSNIEPFVVSHVKRLQNGTDYEDYDIIKNTEINSTSKANATREVHMPFHHLVSKVGFRLFINDPQPSSPDYKVYLKSIKISILNSDNIFITQSTSYSATNAQGLGKGTFKGNTTQTGEYTLLQHGKYTDVDFRTHLNKETAYDLCSNYMQQIPQGNIKIRVQLEMETDHITGTTVDGRNPFSFDQNLSLDPTSTTGDTFTWDPDTRYIYYLHIPNLHGHTIYLHTCEILPWDEVQTTDIPIEL